MAKLNIMDKNMNAFGEKVSVCITTFNEKKETIQKLLNALNNQTLKPNEIILIDAKDYNNCSRSEGRNIAVKKAKNEIVAITDVGCLPHKTWLERITKPLTTNKLDVVAGGYKMTATNNFEKAASLFLGVKTKNIDKDFMPSARSMAFTKTIWKKAGGFPEDLKNTAEDTVFNINLITAEAKFKVVKNAVVDWQMPKNLFDFFKKIKNYAKGDAESGIWWHPVKKFKTHNIKVLTVFARYILFIYFPWLLIFYLVFAYNKAKAWGIILQFTSDIGLINGFLAGISLNLLKLTR